MVVNRWQNFAARLVLLFAASYGLLYFSYKFGMPWSGTGDYSRYYNMYVSPFNLHATQSPFVLRQVSGVLTYLVWKAHIYYPNQIWFQAAGFDQHIFFAALFTNWVFLVLAAATAGVIAEEIAGRRNAMIAVVAGFLCLLSFHTQYVVITGVTEGPSWFLLTVGFLAYLRKMRVALCPDIDADHFSAGNSARRLRMHCGVRPDQAKSRRGLPAHDLWVVVGLFWGLPRRAKAASWVRR
jgi:hypothetical protein